MPNITIRTSEEISSKLSQLAKVMDRPRNWVIEDALKQYISEQSWQVEGIKQAQKSLKEGKGKDFGVAIKNIRAKIKRKRK